MTTSGGAQAPEPTASAPADATQPAPKPPPTPQELIRRTLEVLPELAPVSEQLETVFVCSTQYVGGPDNPVLPTDLASALEELNLLRGWDPQRVKSSCEDVVNALAETWGKLTEKFDSEANDVSPTRGQTGITLEEIRKRLSDEHAEQEALTKQSSGLQERVSAVRLRLGLPAAPFVPSAEPEQQSSASGLAHALRGIGGRVAGVLIAPVADEPTASPAETAPQVPSWRTPPVWTPDDADIKKFELIAKRAAATENAELVWQSLQGFGLTRLQVQELVDHAAEMAQKQITQSQKVMQDVTRSQGEFGHHVESIMRLKDVVLSVYNFFFPQGQPSGAKTA